jgi:hypothetical protein
MKKHRLTLLGGFQGELRVPASVLHETVGALLEGARQATRFFVEGVSVRKGPQPTWLKAACEIQITALSPGSAVLALEAPTLEEADPSRFGEDAQGSFFDEAGSKISKLTSVDLFGNVLSAVVEGGMDDVMADRALLDTCVRFAKAVGGSYEGVRLDGLASPGSTITIKSEHVPKIELLRNETPPSRAVRLTGTLDTISASRPDVVLTLPDGTRVPARLEDHDVNKLKNLFDEKVVVSGMARYRPSGRLLLVDVEWIKAASEKDDLFEVMPVSRKRRPVVQILPQDEASGVSAFFGTWPGDESDEDLLRALRAIR